MARFVPSYITKNRLGIYLFQYKIPKQLQAYLPKSKILVRKSLRTRDHRVAISIARRLIVIMDEIAKKYFHDPEAFGKAMELLMQYDFAKENATNLQEMESALLAQLDDREDYLLEKAIAYDSERRKSLKRYDDKLREYENVLLNSYKSQHKIKYEESENPDIQTLFEKWQQTMSASMKQSSFGEFKRMIELFIRICTEFNNGSTPRVSEINENMIRNYKDTIRDIPKGIKTENKSIKELINCFGGKKSATTIKNTLINVGHFLNWISKEGYPLKSNLHQVLTHYEKIRTKDKKKRVPLDDDDLVKLFNSKREFNF